MTYEYKTMLCKELNIRVEIEHDKSGNAICGGAKDPHLDDDICKECLNCEKWFNNHEYEHDNR